MHVIVKKRPIEVEAIKWTGDNTYEVELFCPDCDVHDYSRICCVDTTNGNQIARIGDWIIKDVNGEFYLCKSDIFEETYEIITEVVGG